jgi:hypothetical protein
VTVTVCRPDGSQSPFNRYMLSKDYYPTVCQAADASNPYRGEELSLLCRVYDFVKFFFGEVYHKGNSIMILSNDLIASLIFIIGCVGVLAFVFILFGFIDLFIRGLTYHENE